MTTEEQTTQEAAPVEQNDATINRLDLTEEDNLTFTVNFAGNGQEATSHEFDALEAAGKMYAMGYKRAGVNQPEMVRIFREAIGLPDLRYSYAIRVLTAFEAYLTEVGKKPQWQPILGLSTEEKLPRCSGTDPESSLSDYLSTPTESEQSKLLE